MLRDYIVFDTETTGLSPETDHLIEIGALKVRDGRVSDRFSAFINPHETLRPKIAELTGITDEMLEGAADQEVVVPAFLDFCEDLVIVGHNLMFDFRFVRNAAKTCGLPFEKQGIDTLKIAKKVHADLPSRSLGALCDHYGIVNDSAHRAYHDALATAKLYQTMAHYHEAGAESLFAPKAMVYKEKKSQPMTKRQKAYLKDLYKYHKIEFNDHLEKLTMSEASRLIDQTILQYGRMRRQR